MRKQLDRKQDLYDEVLERLKEINLVKDYGSFVNEVIAPVELGEKVSPKLSIALPIGAIAGLILGVCIGGVAEFMDPLFHGTQDVARLMDMPLLCQVPKLGNPKDLATKVGSLVSPTIVAYHRPRSRESEVIRGLRTSMFFSLNGGKHKVIEYTSANPGDGKTTVTANVAVSIAQAGHSVLVIDCDMRRPQVTQHVRHRLEDRIGQRLDGRGRAGGRHHSDRGAELVRDALRRESQQSFGIADVAKVRRPAAIAPREVRLHLARFAAAVGRGGPLHHRSADRCGGDDRAFVEGLAHASHAGQGNAGNFAGQPDRHRGQWTRSEASARKSAPTATAMATVMDTDTAMAPTAAMAMAMVMVPATTPRSPTTTTTASGRRQGTSKPIASTANRATVRPTAWLTTKQQAFTRHRTVDHARGPATPATEGGGRCPEQRICSE